ncbi:hypothetical protein CPHLJ_4g3940 [Cryptosporidium parvum]
MSQTIYKTNTLTILKVEDNDKLNNSSDNTNNTNNNSKIEDKEEIIQDSNINNDLDYKKIHRKSTNSVTWDESAIDNEMMNKKKSKKCCIFHKKRNFGESSSSESDSDSESDSSSSCNNKCGKSK